jgi:hypothetical protein
MNTDVWDERGSARPRTDPFIIARNCSRLPTAPSIFVRVNEIVWISTYSQQYLSQYGDANELILDDIGVFLLNHTGFHKMIA